MRKPTELPWPYEWRYLPYGMVRHALNADAEVNVAACGVVAWSYWDWYGTGSWREVEMAAALPDCQRCHRIFARQAEEAELRRQQHG